MFVLHIELEVKQGSQSDLEKIFVDRFCPAISKQAGFIAAQLLRPNEADTNYRLCLIFDRHDSQQTWVATDLHQEVWPLIADLCENYTVTKYTSV